MTASAAPAWAETLFTAPLVRHAGGVWRIEGDRSTATISDQFKADAGEYHLRYAASDHFEGHFRQALAATGVTVAEAPLILDLGSGSGANSIAPCLRVFPGARAVATDLSGELLSILAAQPELTGQVACVVMDAMAANLATQRFDLVTGVAILHHLVYPTKGMRAAARALKPGGVAIFMEPFNGYSLMRLAYERILAEAGLRNAPLSAPIDAAMRAMVKDIAERSAADPSQPGREDLDDKWLFSREHIEGMARQMGFADVRFVPHNDHGSLYRDIAAVQLRLSTGDAGLTLPGWADAILDDVDRAMSAAAKRELMLEGTVVLTMGDTPPPPPRSAA